MSAGEFGPTARANAAVFVDELRAYAQAAKREVLSLSRQRYDRAAHVIQAALAEIDRLTREMHERELHHFEGEQMLVAAGIDPDAAPASPTAAEREALVGAYLEEHGHHADARHGFEAGLAAGWRPPRGPVTDEMVAAALDEVYARSNGKFTPTPGSMRAALEAAEDKR